MDRILNAICGSILASYLAQSIFLGMPDESHEPDPIELEMLQIGFRMRRLLDQGLTLPEALNKMAMPETSDEYLARNAQAMEEVGHRIESPEYQARFQEAWNEPDLDKRATLLAALKRENYASLDIQALHRVISARNRQYRSEGVIPPDIKDTK